MRIILLVIAVLFFAEAFFTIHDAKTVMHQIYGALSALTGTGFLCACLILDAGAKIVRALKNLRIEWQEPK